MRQTGFRCRDEAGAGEWIAVPEAPAETPVPDRGRAKSALRLDVSRGLANVGDRQMSAWLEHSPCFLDRLRAGRSRGDVVNGEARHHEVEGRVGKWERAHVAGLDVDPVLHPFERRVSDGHVTSVSGLIVGAPQIDAGRAAG